MNNEPQNVSMKVYHCQSNTKCRLLDF